MSQAHIKTYVKTLPRHQRFLFFVDQTISETSLRNIMEANLNIWGGRYNPIVPVYNNTITNEWLTIISSFDPDIVYYSTNIDENFLHSLNLFYPAEYIKLREEHRHYFPGINIYCLMHEHVHSTFLINRPVLLRYAGAWDMTLKAKSFYNLNLGFRPLYQEEKKWVDKFESIDITNENANEINKYIFQNKPYYTSLLSSVHLNSVNFDDNLGWSDSKFEWIVYKKDNYFDDLLYFWNRQLYFKPKSFLNQVISTPEEINELLDDEWFGPLIWRFSFDNQVVLVSQTLDSESLNDIRNRMQPQSANVRIDIQTKRPFPYEFSRFQYIKSSYLKQENNLILGDKDILKLPELSFENNSRVDDGPYILDLIIERENTDEHKEIRFPFNTILHSVLCKTKSRVNKQHRASIFASRELQSLELSIPSDLRLIRSILMHRTLHTKLSYLPVDDIHTSSAGQKLTAFLRLFNNDWTIIAQFLEEKFWLQLFRYSSDLKESSIPTGRGIFSYQDLVSEIDKLFLKYKEQIVINWRSELDESPKDELVNSVMERNKKNIFKYHIDTDLNYLIAQSALFVGMKVKCQQCGSNKWYSLTELKDKLLCKGCNSEITPNLNSKVYYRLSDTIINNLKSDLTKNHAQFDGNYPNLGVILYTTL